MNTYQYTMKLSPVGLSQLTSFMEQSEGMKLIVKIPIEIKTTRNEKEEKEDLDKKIGTMTPDGKYEFAGYSDLVKLI